MNDLIRRDGGAAPTIKNPVGLFSETERLASATTELYVAIIDNRRQDVRRHLETLRAATPGLSEQVAATLTPVSRAEIGLHVAKFLGAMKHLGKVDEAIFVQTMIDDIESIRPTLLGLVTGLQKVRMEAEFLPSIAAVVKAIGRADEVYKIGGRRLAEIPARIAEAEAYLNQQPILRRASENPETSNS